MGKYSQSDDELGTTAEGGADIGGEIGGSVGGGIGFGLGIGSEAEETN